VDGVPVMYRICIFVALLVLMPAANAGVCVVGSPATANGVVVQPDYQGAYNILAFFIAGNCDGMYYLPSNAEYATVLSRVTELETKLAAMDSTPWAFDPEAFKLGVGGSLLMFVTGAGVGLVLNIVRQSRRV
jgi:hypothetical protein